MKTINVNLYSFDELNQKQKDKIMSDEINLQRDFFCEECLCEILEEEAQKLLTEKFGKVNNLKLCYDFSYSQGSGLLTEFIFTYNHEVLEVKQNPYNSHYTFCDNFIIEFDEYNTDLLPKDLVEVRKEILKINEKLEKLGYDLIEDDEAFEENAKLHFEDLGECFLENGEQFIF